MTTNYLERQAEILQRLEVAKRAEAQRQIDAAAPQREIEAAQAALDALARQQANAQAAERWRVYQAAADTLRAAVSNLTACLQPPSVDFQAARGIAVTLSGLYKQAEALRPDDGQAAPWYDGIYQPQRPGTGTPAPLALLTEWIAAAPTGWARQERCGLLFAATGFFARPDLDRAVAQASDVLKI